MTWHALPECRLCKHQALDVAVGLVRYAEPDIEGNVYGRIPRCADHAACRKRREQLGEPWPLLDDPRRRP
jgi:hypothetical protein